MDKAYAPAFCSESKYLPTSSRSRSSVAGGTALFCVMMAFFSADPHLQLRVFGMAATASTHHAARVLRVLHQHGDNLVDGDRVVLLVPAVVVGDHGDRGVAESPPRVPAAPR